MNQIFLHRNGDKDRTISNSSQYLLIVVMDLKPETSLSWYPAKENAHSSLVVPSLYIKKPIKSVSNITKMFLLFSESQKILKENPTFASDLVIQVLFPYLYKREFGYRIRSSARYCETRPMKSNSRHATVSFVRNGKALFRVKPGNLPSQNIDNHAFPGSGKLIINS